MTPKAEKIIKLWNEGKTYIQIQQEAETTSATVAAVKKKYPELITRENVITSKPCKAEANPQKSIQSKNISGSNINQVIPENLQDNIIVKNENVDLLKRNENPGKELKEVLESNKKKDEEIRQLKDQLNNANQKNYKYDKLLNDFQTLGKGNSNLSSEIVQQNKYIKDIRAENDNLRKNNKKYKDEINTLKSQLKKANNNSKNHRLEIAKIQAKYLTEKLKKVFNPDA